MEELKTFLSAPFKAVDMNMLMGESMQEHDKAILDLNRQQLDRGLSAKGNSLGRYKNFKYKNRWQPVDLKLTGDFRDKLTLAAGKKSAEVFSQDFKEPFLEKRYGKDIYGVPDQMKGNVAEVIKQTLGEKLRTKLLGK